MKAIRNLYIHNRFFWGIGILVVCFILSFVINFPLFFAKILLLLFVAFVATDMLMLFRYARGVQAQRTTPDRLSNGDENEIIIILENYYPFTIDVVVIDEIPHQFQRRDIHFTIRLLPSETQKIRYELRPVKRGVYSFGVINVFVESPLKLLRKRYRLASEKDVPVYPSYIQMRKYELLAISNKLTEAGIKKIRRIGQNQEFELIKEYVQGDDFRTINWKASARRSSLMVNHYQDERSQQIYCLIDKGRVMQMPFNGLSLLDYAINASLVISNIAIRKSDKAGLITFQDKVNATIPASRSGKQLPLILEALYNQRTSYRESDFSSLFAHVRRKITQRSLLLLFTNFESMASMERQLSFIKSLAKFHLVVVIFFENTEMNDLLHDTARDLHSVYKSAIAEKFSSEKKQIVRTLNQNGVQTLLTAPQNLTVNTINKYLELKSRGMI